MIEEKDIPILVGSDVNKKAPYIFNISQLISIDRNIMRLTYGSLTTKIITKF